MKIRDLLAGRHKDVITIEGHAPVSQAVAEMVAANVGSVLILIDGSIDGIFTERDALRLWFTKEKVHDEPVMRFMTGQLVIVHPEDSLEEAMSVMSQRNIRHLLVVEEEKRPFSPHLTLARSKEPAPLAGRRQAVAALALTN